MLAQLHGRQGAPTREGAVCDASDDLVARLPHNHNRPAQAPHAMLSRQAHPAARGWAVPTCQRALRRGLHRRRFRGPEAALQAALPHLCRRSKMRRQMYSLGMLGRHCERAWRGGKTSGRTAGQRGGQSIACRRPARRQQQRHRMPRILCATSPARIRAARQPHIDPSGSRRRALWRRRFSGR